MRCPICKTVVPDQDDGDRQRRPRTFPFCSERCKLIDLGRWLDGKYQISLVEDDMDEADGQPSPRPGRDDSDLR